MGTHHDTAAPFHKVIEISMAVHIVGNRSQFPVSEQARQAHPKAAGWAYDNAIWVLGYQLPNGQIRMYQELLGHEIAHVLNKRDPEVENPDVTQLFIILR